MVLVAVKTQMMEWQWQQKQYRGTLAEVENESNAMYPLWLIAFYLTKSNSYIRVNLIIMSDQDATWVYVWVIGSVVFFPSIIY